MYPVSPVGDRILFAWKFTPSLTPRQLALQWSNVQSGGSVIIGVESCPYVPGVSPSAVFPVWVATARLSLYQ